MIRHIAFAPILAFAAILAIAAVPAWHAAQAQQRGAMAGSSYLPSTHTKGCSGLMCNADDPTPPPQAYGQEPGAMAGNSYIPSTHTKGCGGLMCDGNDPRRAPGAAPPPPCQGLLCGMTPYGMGRPVTAAEAQRIQEEQARAPAAAPAAAVEPEKRSKRSARRKKVSKTVAARTPDPTATASAASR